MQQALRTCPTLLAEPACHCPPPTLQPGSVERAHTNKSEECGSFQGEERRRAALLKVDCPEVIDEYRRPGQRSRREREVGDGKDLREHVPVQGSRSYTPGDQGIACSAEWHFL
jgi:hypothetical protein